MATIPGSQSQPIGGLVHALEICYREQATGTRQHRALLEQVRLAQEEARERRAAEELHADLQSAE